MNDGQRYIEAEIEGARPDGIGPYGDTFRVQVHSEGGRSKWLSVPAERFDAVKAAAAGTAGGGYRDRAGIDNRANSALLGIERIISDRSVPAAVRLALVAEIMAEEPVLTDPSPAARTVRREVKERRSIAARRS